MIDADEIRTALVQLDELAELWGDEAKFRRARDRIRAALAKHDSGEDDDEQREAVR